MLSVVFNYIVASSIIGCVITAIILLIKNIFKTKQNANWHYYIWFILLLRLIIPYMPQSSFSILNSLSPAVEKISVNQISLTEYSIKPLVHKNSISTVSHKTYTNANGNEAVITYNNTKHDNSNQTYKAVNIKEILAYVWLGGFLLLSGYVCYINLRFQRKLKNASLVHDQTIDTVLKECKTSLNITKDISVFITREVSVPSLWGCIKPCILLPENMQGMLDIIKLRHILYH